MPSPLPGSAALALLRELAELDTGQGVLIASDNDVDDLLLELSSAFAVDVHRAHGGSGWHVFVMHTGRDLVKL